MNTPKHLCPALAACLFAALPATTLAAEPEAVAASPTTQPADRTAAADVVRSLFAAVDARDWAAAEAMFADEVDVNYSALGGPKQVMPAAELVAGWRSALPGFGRTVHEPHRVTAWPAGARASVTADALALHAFGGETWVAFCGYDLELARGGDGAWVIDRIHLSLYDEHGDRGLVAKAAERVASGGPADRPEAGENVGRVDAFFDALETGDLERFIGLWAEDGRQVMPLAPEGFPASLDGRDAVSEQYAGVVGFESQRYDRDVFPTADPAVVVARYRGDITVEPGATYDNHYVGVWRFDKDGRIVEFTEFFNPATLVNGFPGVQVPHYSVHDSGASPASGVGLREVTFDSGGETLAGHLFLPPGFDASRTYPAVVVAGSWTSVKEQMPDTYASQLAARGFVALTFDFRGFGESGGTPRQVEDHALKIADLRAAADFLGGEAFVQDVTGLGVCAGAGYVAHAVAEDDRFARLMLIAPWMHDPAMTEQLYGGRPGGRDGLLDLARRARERYERTGEVTYEQAASQLNPMAAMYVPGGSFAYYTDPAMGAGPHYPNLWAVQAWEPWLTFDAISVGGRIDVPVHVVHSEQGAVPDGVRAFIDRLPGGADSVWIDKYTQQQIYHEPKAVDAAISPTADWLAAQIGN